MLIYWISLSLFFSSFFSPHFTPPIILILRQFFLLFLTIISFVCHFLVYLSLLFVLDTHVRSLFSLLIPVKHDDATCNIKMDDEHIFSLSFWHMIYPASHVIIIMIRNKIISTGMIIIFRMKIPHIISLFKKRNTHLTPHLMMMVWVAVWFSTLHDDHVWYHDMKRKWHDHQNLMSQYHISMGVPTFSSMVWKIPSVFSLRFK